MTKHELATLASKILGVYFMALAAVSVSSALVSLLVTVIVSPPLAAEGLPLRLLPSTFLPSLVQLLVGFTLWRMAGSIADRMVDEPDLEDLEEDDDAVA